MLAEASMLKPMQLPFLQGGQGAGRQKLLAQPLSVQACHVVSRALAGPLAFQCRPPPANRHAQCHAMCNATQCLHTVEAAGGMPSSAGKKSLVSPEILKLPFLLASGT
jgi:hypothetical protein